MLGSQLSGPAPKRSGWCPGPAVETLVSFKASLFCVMIVSLTDNAHTRTHTHTHTRAAALTWSPGNPSPPSTPLGWMSQGPRGGSPNVADAAGTSRVATLVLRQLSSARGPHRHPPVSLGLGHAFPRERRQAVTPSQVRAPRGQLSPECPRGCTYVVVAHPGPCTVSAILM